MPNYTYLCKTCRRRWDDFHLIIDRRSEICCGAQAVIVPRCYIDIFKPMVYEDITVDPIMITSKRQLREECKIHDVTAARLE